MTSHAALSDHGAMDSPSPKSDRDYYTHRLAMSNAKLCDDVDAIVFV